MDHTDAALIFEGGAALLRNELAEFGPGVCERAIMFRLAHHLQVLLCDVLPKESRLRVDCEYNRHIDKIKTISSDKIRSEYRTTGEGLPVKEESTEGSILSRIYPDIVIHERRSDDCNVLVCEIKRKETQRDAYSTDHKRLELLTCQHGPFHYSIGIFAEVDQQRRSVKIQRFYNGRCSECLHDIEPELTNGNSCRLTTS